MKKFALMVTVVAGLASQAHADTCPWICKPFDMETHCIAREDNRFFGEARGLIYLFPNDGYQTNATHASAYTACGTVYPDPIGAVAASWGDSDTSIAIPGPPAVPAIASIATSSCCEQYISPLSLCFARRGSNSSGVTTASYPPPNVIGDEVDWPEILVCGHSGASSYTMYEDDFLGGAAAGSGNAYLDVTYTGSGDPSYEAQLIFHPNHGSPYIIRDGINVRVGSTQANYGTISGANGTRTLGGLTESGGEYSKTIQANLPSNQSVVIGMRRFSFRDANLDVNDDGRFNELDPSALFALLCDCPTCTCDPDALAKFDFDDSLTINQADVDFLQSLIDDGMSSGIFGDTNQDGEIDCNDRSGLALQGYDLDDAEYVITMDFNLDGLIDASDIALADALIPTADFNRDGGINATDISDFYDAYQLGDPSADLDQSGGVTPDDVTLFFAMYSAGC